MADKPVPRTLGATGLRAVSGRIVEDELAPDLKFPYSLVTYQKMKSDAIIAGTLFMIKQFVRKVEVDIKPAGGIEADPEAVRIADIVRDNLFNTMDRSFDQLMSDICSFIENGFGFHEPVYKLDKESGNILWKDFPSRPPSSIKGFKLDSQGYVTGVEQYKVNTSSDTFATVLSGTTKTIPYSRLLHFRTDSEKNNPLGRSILKNAYRSWYIKTKLEEHEAIGVEREMNGLPYLQMPIDYMNADAEEDPLKYETFKTMLQTVSNIRNNEQAGLILPSDRDENGNLYFDFKLIASNGTRSLDTSKIIERYDYRIAQSLLNDFLLMGSTSTGSFALSDNKVNMFINSIEAYLEVIAEQFNRRAIKALFELNGWDKKYLCKLIFKPLSSPTVDQIADFLQKVDGYITPDETLENFSRDTIGAPRRDKSTGYLDKPVSNHQADSQRLAMQASADRSSGQGNTPEPDNQSVEDLEKSLIKSLEGNYNGEA